MTEKYNKLCFANYLEISAKLKRAETRIAKLEAQLQKVKEAVC